MARIPTVCSEVFSYGFIGGGAYNVNIVDLNNRFEERDENWKFPKHEYSASFENVDEESRDVIISMFHACRGRRHSFMMKDWNDFQVRDQLIQVVPGTDDPVQLYKRYEFLPAFTIRPFQAVDVRSVDDTGQPVFPFAITDDNEDEVAGTLDPLTGIFTPTGAWGFGDYRLSCDFLVWVRFDDDLNEMTINNWRNHTADVSLVEDPFAFLPTNVPESWDGP